MRKFYRRNQYCLYQNFFSAQFCFTYGWTEAVHYTSFFEKWFRMKPKENALKTKQNKKGLSRLLVMTVNGQVYLEKWWCFRQFSFLHLSFFHLQFHHLPAAKAEHFILQRGFSFPASSSSLLNGEKMIYSGAIANRKTNFVRLEWKNAKKAESKIFVLFYFIFVSSFKLKKQKSLF